MDVTRMLAQLTKQLTTEEMPRHSRLMVVENFDLRGIVAKQQELEDTPLCTGWLAFVNRAHTLAHVMHRDEPDTYVRIKLGHTFRGVSEEYLRKALYHRMRYHYIF